MTKREWERAELILPTKAVSPLKKELVAAHNAFAAAVREQVLGIYVSLPSKYISKIVQARPGHFTTSWAGELWRQSRPVVNGNEPARVIASEAECIIDDLTSRASRQGQSRLNKPTKAVLDTVMPLANSRTTSFEVGLDQLATIEFDGNRVVWDVEESNHAVERAHESVLGRVFFAELAKIHWTRGTGGRGIGNDEYHQDDDSPGGGGNYTNFGFGPRAQPRW